MRVFLPALASLLLSSTALLAQSPEEAEPLWPGGATSAFFAPGEFKYRVTIESEGGVVTVLEVPPGVFLGVIGPRNPDGSIDARGLPKTITGTLRIRTRRANQLVDGERSLDEIMSRAPFQVTLRDVIVHIEQVDLDPP